ncbi:family 59 putative glycosyltransferase [Cladorrhinum samala]|uniref:Dol-P-Glc:Glc(2)Man(9)GlcNAc(2)-PP-Dol alpha-1,2-glucosyltransferase n=1 Tax=Cladorrhinum samala TaxID=585594 RepID=A0AAV9HZJ4_9PEZI|nr:family 59 putative glycosyltransferase [Cladorrhinum samala]
MSRFHNILSSAAADGLDAYRYVVETITFKEIITHFIASNAIAHLISPSTSLITQFLLTSRTKLPLGSALAGHALTTLGVFFVLSFGSVWHLLVNRVAPEPYLDEVFHIPQAQVYCDGNFRHWDDKITTPPGLYLFSVAYSKFQNSKCTAYNLRYHNLVIIPWLIFIASQCRKLIESRQAERLGKPVSRGLSLYAFHTGVNIALFPVIFFFSGLYYTDVLSTLVVLVAYRNHLLRIRPGSPGLLRDIWTIVLGVVALFMRQTNVFWVVVYMGGLEAVHVLRQVKPAAQEYLTKLHDPPLDKSGPDDWFFFLVTTATTALMNPVKVFRQIWPHLTILSLFIGFVGYNGGVVLGDKSNHVATIHLAQMLYIWPLIAFFSLPLLIAPLLRLLRNPPSGIYSLVFSPGPIYTIPFSILATALSLAVVKFNTIIHPFTLADNRHYMFYIFRYTVLRSPILRLALVIPYTACRWLVWASLAPPPPSVSNEQGGKKPKTRAPEPAKKNGEGRQGAEGEGEGEGEGEEAFALLDSRSCVSSLAPQTSTVLLLFITTALSLITAPLVEPRYFILPWVFYRLLVPAAPITTSTAPNKSSWLGKVDGRLFVETAWFAGINLVTMYIFLFKPYVWVAEGGKLLDEGRLQRFMW